MTQVQFVLMHGTIEHLGTNERVRMEQTSKPTHADNTHLIAMIINILNLLELQFDVSLYLYIQGMQAHWGWAQRCNTTK